MEKGNLVRGVIRFGVFEFDTGSHVLYRKGADAGLEAQPALLLGLLLSRASEVVSRREIEEHLWSPNTEVNVGDGINHVIRRIREVLRDRGNAPQFIETIPKRGYRFIGQIQRVSANEPSHAERAGMDSRPLLSRLYNVFGAVLPRATSHAKRPVIVLSVAAAVSLFFVTFVLATRTGTPVITYVSPILPRAHQSVVIRGSHLGKFVAYKNTDSPYLAIWDTTAHWAAGRIIEGNYDDVMLTVTSWKDSEIMITGFTGMYGHGAWKLNPGDAIEVAVWNPQTGAGPAKHHLRVSTIIPVPQEHTAEVMVHGK